ncbi:MAG: MGMT family protein, partial [Chloroflexota bacterium]
STWKRHAMFNLPDPMPFYKIVWNIVRQIPTGTVATYGQIAAMIPTPEDVEDDDYAKLGPRWVGDAMNAVSRVDEPTTPWHRVINSKGGISLPENSKSAALQRARLRAENVLLDGDERVDLDEFGWEGPDTDWLQQQGLREPRSLKKPRSSKPHDEQPPDDIPQQLSLF